MTRSTGVPTVSKQSVPLGRNRALEAGYYQERMDAAASKRIAKKERLQAEAEMLRAIAEDLRTMKVSEVQKRWGLSYNKLADARAEILMRRY